MADVPFEMFSAARPALHDQVASAPETGRFALYFPVQVTIVQSLRITMKCTLIAVAAGAQRIQRRGAVGEHRLTRKDAPILGLVILAGGCSPQKSPHWSIFGGI